MEVAVPLAPNHPSWSPPVDHRPEALSSVLSSPAYSTRTAREELSIPELPLFLEARSHALTSPLKAAVIDKTKDQSFTFGQLLNDVAKLKAQIQQYLSPGTGLTGSISEEEPRVAFLAPSGYDYVVTQWAIWGAGGVCVPLCMPPNPSNGFHTIADLCRHISSAQRTSIYYLGL